VAEPLFAALLLIPAIAVRVAVRALYGWQRPKSVDPLFTVLSMSSTIMFWVAGLAMGVAMFGVMILFIPVPLIAIALVLMVLDRTRRAQHTALISTLAMAAERGIPMPEAARAFADEMQGDAGIRALALARNLEAGRPLSLAASAVRLRMGSALRLAIRMGETLGVLGPAMRQQLDDSQQADNALRDAIGRLFYLSNVILILVFINTFVMMRIVPVFEKMFEEFELMLPSMTVQLINLSTWVVTIGWVFLVPVNLLLPVFLFGSLLYFAGWLPRGLPLVWPLTKRYDGALVMRGLALAIRRGLPLPAALDAVADSYPISMAVGRLRHASMRIAGGMPWTQALRGTRLISSADAAVLAAAERAGNLPWALEQMADSALRRQTQRLQALVGLAFPIALLLVAMFVGFFVIALFLPLVSLIQGLA
jgi:type II secretory pathway component PulF